MNTDRIKGSIIGLLTGDAIGSHYRFIKHDVPIKLNSIDMLPGPGDRDAGMYSNSTALSLCIMSSVIYFKGINIEDIQDRFKDCYLGGYMNYNYGEGCYLGTTCSQAIKNFSNGMPPDRCGITDANGEDEEALVRVLPVTLLLAHQSVETMLDNVVKLSRLTHATTINDICCSILSLIIRNLILNVPEKVSEILKQYFSSSEEHMKKLKIFFDAKDVIDKPGHATQSFWSSWRVFSNNENDYKKCVSRVLRIGGTNVATGLSGMLCGLQNGVNAIPADWLRSLKTTPEVEDTIDTFVRYVGEK